MTIQLTRLQMTELLYSLKGDSMNSPYHTFQKFITINFNEKEMPSFISKTSKKKQHKEYGLSTNEIVSLANLCELTSLKSTSIQNWIKRDIKELIGPPELGKKYSIDQAAMLLIVKDLKTSLDFEKIRNSLTIVFNTLSDRSDDLISPIAFYEIYAKAVSSFDILPALKIKDLTINQLIVEKIDQVDKSSLNLTDHQWKTIKPVLVIAVLSVIASHFQTLAHIYLTDML
ncbi:DUF1836 domain-containing protein [Metabacillus sp. HB246100]|uniref:DUF1836 domain-containing protein n=1 Tax=Bacillus weihaiensis TaxID=1547283 RepID=UPI002352A9C5|nr:DUF1836 domain-containing protein [Bacillus weihaiensis]